MDKRQKKLIEDYGPGFYKRSHEIQNEFLYLSADAVSVLTDAEWKEFSQAISNAISQLQRTQKIVRERMAEAGVPVR